MALLQAPDSRTYAAKLWRIFADVRDLPTDHLSTLRVLVVTDVLRRVVEDLSGGQVLLVVLDHGDGASGADARTLQVREPLGRVRTPVEASALAGGRADLAVEIARRNTVGTHCPDHGDVLDDRGDLVAVRRLRVAAVTAPGEGVHDLSALPAEDPLAVRLALLRAGYGDPTTLSTARLHRADETLHRWRLKVAAWADMPSARADADHLSAMREALDTSLDSRAVLTRLHRVEVDHSLASGSKFETFVHMDRVLALDLCHLVGKLPR